MFLPNPDPNSPKRITQQQEILHRVLTNTENSGSFASVSVGNKVKSWFYDPGSALSQMTPEEIRACGGCQVSSQWGGVRWNSHKTPYLSTLEQRPLEQLSLVQRRWNSHDAGTATKMRWNSDKIFWISDNLSLFQRILSLF